MKRPGSRFCLLAVISLLLGVIWHASASAAVAPTIVSLGQIRDLAVMATPGRIDVDAAGSVYVTDARKRAVVKFDKYGKFSRAFSGFSVSGAGVAVTPDGSRLYVAGSNEVSIIDGNSGSLLGSLGGFATVGEIDLDAAGYVFVADAGAMVVKVYNAQGGFEYQFGGFGINPGQFRTIWAMSVDENAGEVYVADVQTYSTSYPKVQIFDLAGNLKRSLLASNAFGTPAMTFFGGFTFDSSGRAYFPDTFRNQLRILGLPSAFLMNFGVSGYAIGQLLGPVDCIFDPTTSRLFVTNDGGRIEIFGIDGGQNPVNANVKPGLPVALSPVDGSEVASATPELRFQNATDADGNVLTYEVNVYRDGEVVAGYTNVAETAGSSLITVAAPLVENVSYEWAVQAYDGKDVSGWTGLESFTVNAVQEAPTAPVLTAPLGGVSVAGENVMEWQGSTDADPFDSVASYKLEISEDPAFATLLLQQSIGGTSIVVGDLADYALLVDGGTYFWRVSAVDNHEQLSAPSAVGDFVYDTTQLQVTANVPGAKVFLGGNYGYAGQYLGEVPLELKDFPIGANSVVVERAGFETFIAQVRPAERNNVAVYAQMVPAVAPIDIKARPLAAGGMTLQLNGDAAPFAVDFDNDGLTDLLAGDASGTIRFYRGEVSVDGIFGYAAGVTLALPPMAGAAPFVADWDNDGRKDLLVGSADGTVKLYLNTGTDDTPAFGAGSVVAADGLPINVVAAAVPAVVDVDGDKDKDLVVGSASGSLYLFRNIGSDAAPQLNASGNLVKLASQVAPFFADWDADGVLDLLLAASEHLYVYEAQSDGTYAAAGVLTVGAELTGGGGKSKTGAYSLGDNLRVFAYDADGRKGKDLYIGNAAGEVRFARSNGKSTVPAFNQALLDKVDQISEMVAVAAPEQTAQVAVIRSAIEVKDMAAALAATNVLASVLEPGSDLAFIVAELSTLLQLVATI